MNFTPQQAAAIDARGNVLVMAGAGTGKTRTLVERCVRRLLDPLDAVSLEEILMVTFTEAAAAEMRQRIRARLEQELSRAPENPRLVEQLALLDTAQISTLHSFCLQLVREHFHELGLDPELSVLDESEARLLAAETLEQLFNAHYAGQDAESLAVQHLIQSLARGWDLPVRELVLALHEHTQTRPDPEGWFERELTRFASAEPHNWLRWLHESFAGWAAEWREELHAQPVDNVVAHACAGLLEKTLAAQDASRAPIAATLAAILDYDDDRHWPRGTRTKFHAPIEGLFAGAKFLHSVSALKDGADPLAEDWNWVRGPMTTLLKLAREFSARYAEAKREAGAVDFHDLEQFALQLLWDARAGQATPLAARWREKFKLVFVDEYQDINAAQDCILAALSREGAAANRFLVGDVKQSIYRFRQAAPRIFQDYAARWGRPDGGGQVIALADNFRSAAPVLEFINALFGSLIRPELGGVAYDEAARLRFGGSRTAGEEAPPEASPRVEVCLRLRERNPTEGGEEAEGALDELSEAEREARLVALRLRERRASGQTIWDEAAQRRRPADWRDMVILLRSPRGKVEAYAKEFARAGVPLQATRSGFFESIEVLDLLNLLRLLDNPLQDIPAIAVLRSPLVGLTLEELATLRIAVRKVRFWTALRRWHESQASLPSERRAAMFAKVAAFLGRFERWRRLARQAALAQRLELILSETSYLDWLLTQPRGAQRQANVQQLLALARHFDQSHRQGLYRFLQMIEDHQTTLGDREPAPLESANAVRLMSIHQSKGLEFPIVVVADLGKRFNLAETTHGVLLDETRGLCPQVKPPQSEQRYPSIASWLAQREQRAEALGEELRILYVALTRAREELILVGSCAASRLEKWREGAAARPVFELKRAGSYLDWLGPWLAADPAAADFPERESGATPLWRWRVCRDAELADAAAREEPTAVNREATEALPPEGTPALVARLQWHYPHEPATREPAKTTVTALRRKIADETDDESSRPRFVRAETFAPPSKPAGALTAAEVGNAHHRFQQLIALERTGSEGELASEAQRLVQAGLLTPVESAALDLAALADFWQSDLGRQLRAEPASVRRELAFTLRLSGDDLTGSALAEHIPPGEFIIAQGVVDLALIRHKEIWVLDFKTDQVTPTELPEKVRLYAPQLQLYALALGRIHGRPVTQRWLHFLAARRTVPV